MVVVVDSKNPYLADALAASAEVRQLDTAAITCEALLGVDAVIVRSETKVGPMLLEGTPVRFVGSATIGTDHVDLDYLAKRGIGFASAPGSNANSVAEYVAAALLEIGVRLAIPLRGSTLGVVGVGNVGSRVAAVGRALGMEVVLNDPPLARATGDGRFVGLDELMQADVITLHVPLTRTGADPTFHLFDGMRLGRMKRGGILLNTSRGSVVDAGALHAALTSGHIVAAVLDVWEGEPDIDPGLLEAVAIGTPHIAGYSFDGKVNAAHMMFDALVRHFGIGRAWPSPANLPAPRCSQITLAPLRQDVQETLRRTVAQCYSLEDDDNRFRALLSLPAGRRREEFRRQRSAYPARREFHATSILGIPAGDPVGESLLALGFTVQSSPEVA